MKTVDDLKLRARTLIQQREALERRIAESSERLTAAGVGLKGNLVDKEGFPRSDIDVAAARADRHRVAVLTNDHKGLTSEIETLLHQLHAEHRESPPEPGVKKPRVSEPATQTEARPGASLAQPMALQPFAEVDEVAEGGPASQAGVLVGDQLCRFGTVVWDGTSRIRPLAAELQANENKELEAIFLREGTFVTLRFTPHRWSGQGMLGCHLKTLI